MTLAAQPTDEEGRGPEKIIPGSIPLADPKRELFSRLRAAGYGRPQAGHLAGYSMKGRAYCKAEKARNVQDRIAYLSREPAEITKEHRALLTDYYKDKIRADNFCKMDGGALVPDLERLEALSADEQRALKSVMIVDYNPDGTIKNWRFDPRIGLEAAAQLRQMNGLDEARFSKHEVTGKDGGPMQVQFRRAAELSDDELASIVAGRPCKAAELSDEDLAALAANVGSGAK